MKLFLPIFLLSCRLFAQAPAFEAAAIKPSNQPPGHSSMHTRTGMMTCSNVSLRQLIRDAYRVNDNQIDGGPKWMDADRFDINARAAGPAEGKVIVTMLQNLLADRFQLRFHKETRPLPGYALVITKGGMKIKPVEAGETNSNTNSNNRHVVHNMEHVSMAAFAEVLSRQLHAPVSDETGANGVYSFTLEYMLEEMSAAASRSDAQDDVTVFTALQEKLGLKLEARKVPTEIFIIDSAEKPIVD
jgi:uncharacterized protein (TIGR03435 family)